MRVAIGIGVTTKDWKEMASYVREAERLGVDAVWSAESWGNDAVSPLGYLAAQTSRIRLGTGIMQIAGRTPAMTSMTALTLAAMSDGRFDLGLGASGPQVVEGWHGQKFGSTPQRLREYVEIVRMATRGEHVRYDGKIYQLPLPGGEGKPIKTSAEPRNDIPIYLATLSPKSLQVTGEVADGWVGTSFMPEHADVHFAHIRAGAERAGRAMSEIDLQAGGTVEITDDVERAILNRKRGLAFTLGAMGSRQHNFYNQAFQRAGYHGVADQVQALWLGGKRPDAAALVPDEMVVMTNMLGTRDMVKARIRAYRDAGVTTLRVDPSGETTAERIATLGETMELVREVNGETPQLH